METTTAIFQNSRSHSAATFPRLTFLTLNTNGLRVQAKRRAMFNDFRQAKAEIIFLQETHSVPSDTKIWNSEWGAKIFYAHGRSNSKGVAILFKRGFNLKVIKTIPDPEGRFLVLQVLVEGEILTLINIYAPTQNEGAEQASFLENLNSTIDDLEIADLFMGGDFNVQIHWYSSRLPANNTPGPQNQRSASQRDSYIARINDILDYFLISDPWKHKHPHSNQSTFHRGSQHSTLDYWFMPRRLLDSVSNYTITTHPLSDHSLLSVTLEESPQERGPGYWRFNNQLLEDPEFIRKMNDHIATTLRDETDNPMLLWEWVKYKIRQFCIQYSKITNKARIAHTKSLENRLGKLAHDHNMIGSPDIEFEAASIKRELVEIKIQQANKIIFRARARWAMAGEKPSAYFLGLEKRQRKLT